MRRKKIFLVLAVIWLVLFGSSAIDTLTDYLNPQEEMLSN